MPTSLAKYSFTPCGCHHAGELQFANVVCDSNEAALTEVEEIKPASVDAARTSNCEKPLLSLSIVPRLTRTNERHQGCRSTDSHRQIVTKLPGTLASISAALVATSLALTSWADLSAPGTAPPYLQSHPPDKYVTQMLLTYQ